MLEDALNRIATIRFTEKEYDEIQTIANNKNISFSDFVRELIFVNPRFHIALEQSRVSEAAQKEVE